MVAGGLGALEIAFEPGSPRYGLFLVWGCRRPMCTNCGTFGGLLGAVHGHIVELEGPRGTFGTGKSSCMCRVATISLHLAVLSRFQIAFGEKKADFGPKLQILKWRCGTCDTRSRKPPLKFWLILGVVVPHTHRYHPPKFWPNPKHHDGAVIFAHFARACCLLACLLAACCLLLAKSVRSTLDTKEGYKTKTGGQLGDPNPSPNLALALTLG